MDADTFQGISGNYCIGDTANPEASPDGGTRLLVHVSGLHGPDLYVDDLLLHPRRLTGLCSTLHSLRSTVVLMFERFFRKQDRFISHDAGEHRKGGAVDDQ